MATESLAKSSQEFHLIFPCPLSIIQAGYLYIPANDEQRRCWGELSGCREKLRQRNREIQMEYGNGSTVECLAGKYFLSEHTIRKILNQNL